jgi:Domain of unknown function (DUF3480)
MLWLFIQVVSALNDCQSDNFLALEAEFNVLCDSHLVCIESTDGCYQTQAIKIAGRQRSGKSKVLLFYLFPLFCEH